MSRYCDFDHRNKKVDPVYGHIDQSLLSLENALSPILNKIQRLNHYIALAKRHCCYPSNHGLTRDESAAVYIYTMEWGDQSICCMLNGAIRSNDPNVMKPWFQYMKLFVTGILKLPIYNGNVWRGDSDHVSQHYEKDQKFTWWTFTSCSTSLDVINELVGEKATLFLMEIINARNVSGYTGRGHEDEVILLPGTSFCVINIYNTRSGMHIMHIRQREEEKGAKENHQSRDNGTPRVKTPASNVQNREPVRPSATNDRRSPVRNNRKPSVQRELRAPARNDSPRRNLPRQDPPRSTRIDKPLPTREPQEPISCGGHACKRCHKCSDWKWNHRSNDWSRTSDATCRSTYTVDQNKHYVRGIGGGRGGGGIYPLCECDT